MIIVISLSSAGWIEKLNGPHTDPKLQFALAYHKMTLKTFNKYQKNTEKIEK